MHEIIQSALVDALQRHKTNTLSKASSLFTTARADIIKELKLQQITVQGALRQQKEDFNGLIQGLHKARTLVIGKDSYLAQCRAPNKQDQQAYKSRLLHATFNYIIQLGNPNQRVAKDKEVFTSISRAFPTLDKDHISTAINHVYIQVYSYLLYKGWE